MVVKTITVTEDAYESLKRLKHEDESFSEVIKRLAGKKMLVKDLLGILKKSPEEHEEFIKRVKRIREEMSKDMGERIERVRARYNSAD